MAALASLVASVMPLSAAVDVEAESVSWSYAACAIRTRSARLAVAASACAELIVPASTAAAKVTAAFWSAVCADRRVLADLVAGSNALTSDDALRPARVTVCAVASTDAVVLSAASARAASDAAAAPAPAETWSSMVADSDAT